MGFDLFESWKATAEDIAEAEAALGTQLPMKYQEFMRRYGGGMFLFLELLPIKSPDGTEEDLLAVNHPDNVPGSFVAVASVGSGDWWGFVTEGGACHDEVSFYDHEDGTIHEVAPDFLEFVINNGLQGSRTE